MKSRQSSFEGYLEIDARESPGISPELARRNHTGVLPAIPVEGGKLLQAITKKCSHCPTIVVLRPDRNRARGYCPKCDAFVCDRCETNRVLTGECYPWRKRIDEWFEAASRGRQPKILLP